MSIMLYNVEYTNDTCFGPSFNTRFSITGLGCVNVWEPKVIRSGAGAHFRIPVLAGLDWTDISNVIGNDTFVAMAESPPPG